MKKYDFIVIGGGIAGIASAEILQRSGHSVLLLEKEPMFGSRSSGTMHGWFHTGALYAALPDMSFFKTMVGNLDDLVNYYSCFDRMNLEVGHHLMTREPNGWFSNNLNLYTYSSPGNSEISLGMKLPWYIAIKNARRRLEAFDKLSLGMDMSVQASSFKMYKTKSTVYEDSLPFNLDNAGTTFITKDRTMNAHVIMKDLLRSFVANGGEYLVDCEVYDYSGVVKTSKGDFTAKTKIVATGDANKKAKSVYASPLAVIYPAVTDINFIKMTPVIANTFNHIGHRTKDFNYSVIGNGMYVNPNDEKAKAETQRRVEDRIKEIFRLKDFSQHDIEIYYGMKTEITTNSQLRNYQYHIIREDDVVNIFPGKFTLCFSLAVNLCRRLGIDPVTMTIPPSLDTEADRELCKVIDKSLHYKIAEKFHLASAQSGS